MAAHRESVDLSHFDDPEGVGPPSLARRRAFYVDLCRFATSAAAGPVRTTSICCKKRPGRRACPGYLDVRLQNLPSAVHWRCPDCGTDGRITGWEDGDADLRHYDFDATEEDHDFVVDILEHAALRELARNVREMIPVVFRAKRDGDSVVLRLSEEEERDTADVLAQASLLAGPGRTGDRLQKVGDRLARRAGGAASGFTDLGALRRSNGPALVEAFIDALLDLPDVAPPELHPVRRARPRRSQNGEARPRAFQVKVSLRFVRPPIWRRLLVPSDITLPTLHRVIQEAMGWFDCHLHLFRKGRSVYSPARDDFDAIGEDSTDVALDDLISRPRQRLIYEYDFGDGWEHDVLLEKVLDEECVHARCLTGRRRCPPEDCGGPGGYAALCEAHRKSAGRARDAGLELLPDFDPDDFDVRGTDASLQRIRLKTLRG